MKKALYVATVDRHIKSFHLPYLKLLHDNGYEVHVATNGDEKFPFCDVKHQISIERSPFKLSNIKAIKQLRKIIEKEKFDVVDCHTPMGAVVARLASKKARKKHGTRVIYMAHGFHFYQGAPLINWLTFYPIEKFLSRYTDDLITINTEDFELAKKKMKAKRIHRVHGVGVDKGRFTKFVSDDEKKQIREKLQVSKDDFVIFFAGELNHNKNQIAIIEALKDLAVKEPHDKLLLAGSGPLEAFLKEKIQEYHLENQVFLIGYRNDIPDILSITDLYISMSKREGLGLNVVEAMLKGVPVIVSNNRGHRDIVSDGSTGYLIETNDIDLLKTKIEDLYQHPEIRQKLSANAMKDIDKFCLNNTIVEMEKILFDVS